MFRNVHWMLTACMHGCWPVLVIRCCGRYPRLQAKHYTHGDGSKNSGTPDPLGEGHQQHVVPSPQQRLSHTPMRLVQERSTAFGSHPSPRTPGVRQLRHLFYFTIFSQIHQHFRPSRAVGHGIQFSTWCT